MGCPGASGPGPRAWVLRLLLGLAAWRGGAGGRSPVCGCCPGPARNGSSVASYCRAHPALELRGRCCVGPEPGAIVGLDLGNCSLTLLCAGFPDASAAVVISLPLALECPGGSMAWDRITTHSDSRTCQGQRNPCNSSGELAWLCPENSLCSPDGPGLVQCLCAGSYHGYKCLREGTFPMLLFYGILGAVTTTLSLLAWGTQRRKAKAS
nr:all-trans retinoic acid-induced differentiation factor isoform X2 [Caretta caretta]